MPKPGNGPPLDLLRECLDYDPETGIFTRRIRCGRVPAGAIAGAHRGDYISICVGNRSYLAHRLAWQYVHGKAPTGEIDHINGNKADNRIANLRDVDVATNRQNERGTRRTKITGLPMGVYPNGPRFTAYISVWSKPRYLGRFATPEEAHEAYLDAKRKLHAGCTL